MATNSTDYNFAQIEPHWQKIWDEQKTFRTTNDTSKPKFYALDMFPYPSGAGLHIGHPEGYTATDIITRAKRAQGFNVLHPIGWDAFGLPAEQHAVKTGTHPSTNTRNNTRATLVSRMAARWPKAKLMTAPAVYSPMPLKDRSVASSDGSWPP